MDNKTHLIISARMFLSKYIPTLSSSRYRWFGAVLVFVILDLLLNLFLLVSTPALFLKNSAEGVNNASILESLPPPTSTPFQPLRPTPIGQFSGAAPAASTPVPEPSTDFYGINFSPGSARIIISIQPQTGKVNKGNPILLAVKPASSCRYQDHRACISAYRKAEAGNVIFITVHSGIGGEAEDYRRAVEGMGLNQASFSLKQIRSNLEKLENASVQIIQAGRVLGGLRLVAAARVPPFLLHEYFSGSAEQSMQIAAAVDLDLHNISSSENPILVFETCGWKLPGEPWSPGVSNTTGSIYLGAIQLAQ